MGGRTMRAVSPYWLAQVAGWSAFGLVTFLTLLPTVPASVVPRLAATKATRAILGLSASHALHRLYISARPGIWAVPVVMVLGVLWYVVFLLITGLWGPAGSPGIAWRRIPHESLESIIVLAAWSAIDLGMASWQRAEAAQRDALRYQLNPHFLFNALSSIRALILENPQRAREMVTGFAELLRHTLEAPANEERPLCEEALMIEQYLTIERERFGAALDASVDVARDAGQCLIPVFVLQPLVENAITHGRRTSAVPLRVRISARVTSERLSIEVANTGHLGDGNDHQPVGLANVRQRLALRYRDRQRFALTQDDGWVRATIDIERPSP